MLFERNIINKSFWGLIWVSFLKCQGTLVVIVSICLPFILWILSPKVQVSLSLILPLGILSIFLVIVFFDAAFISFNKSKNLLPKVLLSKIFYSTNNEPLTLFLLEPSLSFSHDAMVSFYFIDNDFEQLIGIGVVLNIQQDGKIQVMMTKPYLEHKETLQKLANNDNTILNKTIVKPIISKRFLDELFIQGGS